MDVIERLSELNRVPNDALRTWLEARLMELFEEGIRVQCWIVEPGDEVLTVGWLACWGQEPDATASLEDLLTVVEYVEEQPSFFAAVVPANHEAGLILIVPKTAALDADLWKQLQQVSVTLEAVMT